MIKRSKYIAIFFDFTFTPLSAGVHPMMRGGASSYHPPSGCPIFAQEARRNVRMKSTQIPHIPPGGRMWRMVLFMDSLVFLYAIYICSY